jgi:hypothetical protein
LTGSIGKFEGDRLLVLLLARPSLNVSVIGVVGKWFGCYPQRFSDARPCLDVSSAIKPFLLLGGYIFARCPNFGF